MNKGYRIVFFSMLMGLAGVAHAIISVVAAENFYGQVAKTLGGRYVAVTTLMDNPNQDPHLFSLSPRTVLSAHQADIFLYNGADYDNWALPLLDSHPHYVINVSQLIQSRPGDNPHIWYRPDTMIKLAALLTERYQQTDPPHAAYFKQQWAQFMKAYQPLDLLIHQLHAQFNGVPIIATEPIFNEMAKSIGFTMHAVPFQEAIMNDVTPSISEIKAFNDDLSLHRVRLLIYNKQVQNSLSKTLQRSAEQEGIPTVGVTESLPAGMGYISWMISQLKTIEEALKKK